MGNWNFRDVVGRVTSIWERTKIPFVKTGSSFSEYEKAAVAAFFFIFLGFAALLLWIQKLELLPTSFGAIATALFAFMAYRFSKERFRLDLAEKRWAIYEATLEFCSIVTQEGRLKATRDNEDKIRAAFLAADRSFRSIGYHRSKALFGDDIQSTFQKLNDDYAWFLAFSDGPSDESERGRWAQEMHDRSLAVYNRINSLPELFKPYLYFGDYRR